jgi:hypothetical protein
MSTSDGSAVLRLFEDVLNAHDIWPFRELVRSDVVDHQQVIFAQGDGSCSAQNDERRRNDHQYHE